MIMPGVWVPRRFVPQVWVMYHSKVKTKQVYIHDATYATPFSLMLWGGHIRHDRSAGRSKKEGIDVIIGERASAMVVG